MNISIEIRPDSVLRAAERCVVRPQVGKYLFYSARTGELHLVPETGFYAYQLCDGMRTVAEVAVDLASRTGAPAEVVEARIREFFTALADRKILEVVHA
jgi:hypothetical protein